MSRYATFLGQYRDLTNNSQQNLDRIGAELRHLMRDARIEAHIEHRLKTPLSSWLKMQRYGLELEDLHDLLGVRVVVNDVPRCYQVLQMVNQAWPGRSIRFKDYIARPKPNGYQSLHTTVLVPRGDRFELQIRTSEMHLRSLFGSAAHWRYKDDTVQPPPGVLALLERKSAA